MKLKLALLILIIPTVLFSQDTIRLKDGTVIPCIVDYNSAYLLHYHQGNNEDLSVKMKLVEYVQYDKNNLPESASDMSLPKYDAEKNFNLYMKNDAKINTEVGSNLKWAGGLLVTDIIMNTIFGIVNENLRSDLYNPDISEDEINAINDNLSTNIKVQSFLNIGFGIAIGMNLVTAGKKNQLKRLK